MIDPTGVPLFQHFVQTVRSQGAGFVAYCWPKPGQAQPVDKLSSVAGFAPWGWVIGSGVYTDDLRAEFWAHVRGAGLAIVLVLALTGLAMQRVGSPICRGLAHASQVARAIAQGDVRDVHGLVRDVATARAAQGGGIGQVHQHVAALEQMTQQNAALVEQSASAAGGLRDQATQLNAAVRRVKLQAVGLAA